MSLAQDAATLRQFLATRYPNVERKHLRDAIAYAYGFANDGELQRSRGDVRAFDQIRFAKRLESFGYNPEPVVNT